MPIKKIRVESRFSFTAMSLNCRAISKILIRYVVDSDNVNA